jgi:transposase
MNKPSRLIKFVETAWGVVRNTVKKYSSKYSKKKYTQQQHMMILCLMKRLKMHYRDVVDILKELPRVRKVIGLKDIPHFTTPNKFLLRLGIGVLEIVQNRTVKLFRLGETVGIDSSGLTQRHASRYYTRRCKLRKTFLKHNISVDTSTQCIITTIQNGENRHDTLFFPLLLLKARRLTLVSNVVADKGYDSAKNRKLAGFLGIKPVIPYKEVTQFVKESNRRVNKRIYHQRSKVETVFSVIKRKFDDTVHSKKVYTQKKEARLLDIVYNVYRYCITVLFFIEVFYVALERCGSLKPIDIEKNRSSVWN